MVYFLLLIFFGFMFFCVARSIYYSFDHSYFDNVDALDSNASIVNLSSEKVSYEKNGAKYKTTVTFSDGFRFVTHKTNRQNSIMTYTISIDEELRIKIIESALNAHRKAVDKRNRSNEK